jgi:CheY-like chemotaxis protein
MLRKKIAIIDDNHLDRVICRKMIERISPFAEILEFANAIDALQYLLDYANEPEKLPDSVLLDIRMPLVNGWEYLENYAKLESQLTKHPRHYIYTSSIDPSDLSTNHKYVYGLFSKPFDELSLSKIT